MKEERQVEVVPWQLPPTWAWQYTGEIFDIISGGTPKTDRPEFYNDGQIPWITPADLSGYKNMRIGQGARYITEAGLRASSARLIKAGSILYSSRAPIGYIAIADEDVTTNQGFKSFVPPSGLLPEYVYYYLHRAKSLIVNLASGTTFAEISGKKAADIPFAIAPFHEQRRIVTKLEELFSGLDAATAALERVQANLKRYRASVLKSAVEGKLTAEWRAKNPPKETGAQLLERILKERRAKWAETQLAKFKAQGKEPPKDWQKKYSEPVKPDTTDLPELPEGWVWASFESIVQIISGNAFPSEAFTRQGVPVVKIANISYGEFIDKDQEYLPSAYLKPNVPYRIESQDLLLTLTRPITNGQVKVAFYPVDYPPALLNQRVAALRSYGRNSTERQLFDRYLMILLQSTLFTTFVRKNVNETLQPNLSPVKLAEWQIPLPPENEIRHLIEKTESLGIDLSRLMTDLPTHDKRGSNLRQAILKQAFEGKLVPQDPNDEPASELLKRIREERISEAANKTIRPELKQQKPKTKHVRSVKKSKSITNRKRA